MQTITTMISTLRNRSFKCTASCRQPGGHPPQLKCRFVLTFFQRLPACLVGLEARGSLSVLAQVRRSEVTHEYAGQMSA